jgi:cell fate regulator YaaT (PSP1 superfamily)
MPQVVRVSFRPARRPYLFDVGGLEVSQGDWVVAPTIHGLEFGVVMTEPRDLPQAEVPPDLKRLLRKATEDDLRRVEQNAEREANAMVVAAEKVFEHDLPMKLIKAESTLDGGKMVIHFAAEGRVDFRTLVRDLARALHCRVELHQVGVRDEAKLRGGLGPCGRELCCATFLTTFDPVGIRMAKEQDLSLNPQKISGACGRLMCCLAYEYSHYRDEKRGLPKVGSRIPTPQGEGRLSEINVLQERAVITLEEGQKVEMTLEELAGFRPSAPPPAEPEEEEGAGEEDWSEREE